ncbi:MAG: DUF1320 domain-containing protein [Actinobacteria bacterium]|nr:DUF1320 domain-containing protein [Actinomycetota bacterium]
MTEPRYITVAELVNEIPESMQGLLSSDGTNLDKNEPILKEKIKDAEGVLESYLSARYTIPVMASDGRVPPSVKGAIIILTKYFLYGRRDAISQEINEQYNSTMRWLRDVSKGVANIALIKDDNEVEDTGATSIEVNPLNHSQFKTFV